ncbi:isocitrate lyase/PEP mutase family protein [Subtercola endophyticus]|uniref:isocitrate lyase/PEP mutase family protein n=1 Tax=Subtercola endophyticus TaxID=2895559 RepID=UPI001E3330B4|nr:isocitrate lyase/PEP mutase family protein [Subtercola endophyticus]UFS60607.1 isocitrate lyase/PEP mutase family protein [Subtercola endophyticus]
MARSLRSVIDEHSPLIVPSIYDGISALLVKELGFDAAYVGSYATGATKYGVPDIGYIGLEDMADQARRLSAIVDVPLIVDGEGGWGNPLHVARAVRVLERAGAAATHIEDHEFGKHLVRSTKIAPVGVAVDKIKAALDARDSEDFLIIARTDSPGSEGPVAAVDRLLAYQEAGADGLFIGGFLDEAAHARLRAEAHVPIFQPDFPQHTAADHARQSADVVIYYGLTHIAASEGMRSALGVLKAQESTISLEGELSTQGFDEFLGIEAARTTARKFGLIEG